MRIERVLIIRASFRRRKNELSQQLKQLSEDYLRIEQAIQYLKSIIKTSPPG